MIVRGDEGEYAHTATGSSHNLRSYVTGTGRRGHEVTLPGKLLAYPGEVRDDYLRLTMEERERAMRARRFHARQGHPGNDVLCDALDHGVFQEAEGLTGRDVKNAEKLYGPCEVCAEAKMTAPDEPKSQHAPAERVGQALYIDLHAIAKDSRASIGGHRVFLIGTDEKSGYPFKAGLASKTQKSVCEGLDSIIDDFNQYGHRVESIIFDNEAVFIAVSYTHLTLPTIYSV